MKTKYALLLMPLLAFAASSTYAIELPIKDLSDIEHDRENILTGIGLVTGLNATGGTTFPTRTFMVNLYQRFGVPFDPIIRAALENNNRLTTTSMSVVVVTAKLSTTDQIGKVIDVTVSVLDDATDINNGELVRTNLFGMDKCVYAVASGRVNTGGLLATGAAATVQKNHPTTGHATAIVENRVPNWLKPRSHFRLLLRDANYETATRIQDVINVKYPYAATIEESGIVRVDIPPRFYEDRFRFISMIQQERVVPGTKATVHINSQTGTVIVSDTVKLSRVAITQGNISVITGESAQVSQPLPLSEGQTVVVPQTEIEITEDRNPLTVIGEATTVTDLAEALNALSVSPQDLSSIFRELHSQHKLHAKLIIK